jgi:hypothetical protein
MQKYILMTQFHCRTAELFAEAESVAGDLIHKYGLDKVQNADIPQEDVDRYNQVIKQLNTQIWSMFLIMPDESYGNIMRAIPSGVLQLKDVRGRLLCGMRKAQFPRTAYATPESIRLFYYLEKQETPNQGVKRTGDPLRGSPAAHP